MRGGVGIESQRTGGLTAGVVKEHWGFALCAVCGVDAVEAMRLA